MPGPLTRIISDIHYGDRMSLVRSFDQLRPLLAGVDALAVNGDALDTRPGPDPAHTARCLEDVRRFVGGAPVPVTFVTGNHDPDFSTHHLLELEGGKLLLIHGDILFDNIVPWGRDARLLGQRVREAIERLPDGARHRLEDRLLAYRRVSSGIRQRHQSERHPLRYAFRLITDTLLPPGSAFGMLHAWKVAPRRAAALASLHRPQARFVLFGHTHRPGIWRRPGGPIAINTGSFTFPFGAYAVDASADLVIVRKIVRRAGEFHPGPEVAAFPL